jgi:hypothetical protein
MQLRAWELAEHTDEEAKIFVDAIPGRDSRSTHSADENSLEDTKIDRTGKEAVPNLDDMNLEDVAAMASFAAPTSSAKARMVAPFLEPFGDGGLSMTHPPFTDDPRAGSSLVRPKVFGPERVVQDPRVKVVHERFIRQMYTIALYGVMVSLGSVSSEAESLTYLPNPSYFQRSFSQFRVPIIPYSLVL